MKVAFAFVALFGILALGEAAKPEPEVGKENIIVCTACQLIFNEVIKELIGKDKATVQNILNGV